jgi:nitric oxide reductase NorD protein
VLVLLDASGSTNDPVGSERKVIEVEKHAASILGQGLHVLGDRFAICGFNSNGPERCSYYVYKDFDQAWDRRALQSVLSATPSGATRIGPALRHSGYRLGRIAARQKLILVITDGRPMDSNYDPQTQHAQYDVRMANEENARAGIHTFGISTEENSVADMEIMFPHRRFAILPDIRHLLSVLPKAYIRLTT